jgi:3-oxoacyl-[acyl-carrier protein] reductase
VSKASSVNPTAFEGKKVIVTGAASGFGTAIAEQFTAGGATVLVADINEEGAKAVAARLPGALAFTVDLGEPEQIKAMIDFAAAEFGQIDVLCNNAGVPHKIGFALDLDIDTFERQFNVNVRSVFLATKYAYPHMPDGSVIVNTASISAIRPRPGRALYNASKGAVETLTQSLATELAPRIRVNAINPVASHTGFVTAVDGTPDLTAADEEKIVAGIPMGRQALPDDIAAAVTFLASPAAEFLTGVCLNVDGGRSVQ